jgi:tetratricopeptide (TPR) repeat protein
MFSWESEVLSLMDGGHYEQAFARLRELESQTEDDSEEQYVIQVNKADCLMELGHFKEALELFEAFEKKDGLGIEDKCLNFLGEARCFEGMGRFRNARRCLQQVRKLDTDGIFSISVEFVEIDIEFDEGRDAEAIEHAVSFLKEYAEELADPENEGSAHKLKIKVACELVNNRQSQRGIGSDQSAPANREG